MTTTAEDIEKVLEAQARQRRLFIEMTRRLTMATAVVDAARVYVATGRDRAGYGQLRNALEEFDK